MPVIRYDKPNWKNSWVIHLTACEGSDDFNVYNGYPVKAQQKCLAHLQGTTVLEKGEGLFSVSVGTDELSVCMKPSPFSIVNIPRRHFKKVIKLGHGNNPVLGQAFLDLIDEAEAQHRCLARYSRRDSLPNVGF